MMQMQARAFTTEDRAYLTHGDRRFMLRLFRPAGVGPHPAVIEVHGGAWCDGDRNDCQIYAEAFARAGLLVAAIDFRHAGDSYPSSLADINFAIRWVKAHARELGAHPERIGIAGQSSGGHLAMLAAMRPADPRYAAIPLDAPVDARVGAVAMLWPVINPLSRYRNALRARASASPPAWVGNIPDRHNLYWKTEATMEEGNPMLALERGEPVEIPPAMWLQGRPDPVHDYRDPAAPIAGNEPERFAANYRRAGGAIELLSVEQAARQSEAALAPVAAFLRRHLRA